MLPIATISLSSPLTRGPNRALASRSIVFVGSEFHTLDRQPSDRTADKCWRDDSRDARHLGVSVPLTTAYDWARTAIPGRCAFGRHTIEDICTPASLSARLITSPSWPQKHRCAVA